MPWPEVLSPEEIARRQREHRLKQDRQNKLITVGIVGAVAALIAAAFIAHAVNGSADERSSDSEPSSDYDYASPSASPSPSVSGKHCTTGCACGNSCISCSKVCRQ